MRETNMFGGTIKNVGRFYELTNHFLDQDVEITLRDGTKMEGKLNFFSEEFIILSGQHILNIRYVINISVIN